MQKMKWVRRSQSVFSFHFIFVHFETKQISFFGKNLPHPDNVVPGQPQDFLFEIISKAFSNLGHVVASSD
tara:strand:+ start:3248 stop:3457 length:210 start_codon:yes stop_codon:yes gene_type:complete